MPDQIFPRHGPGAFESLLVTEQPLSFVPQRQRPCDNRDPPIAHGEQVLYAKPGGILVFHRHGVQLQMVRNAKTDHRNPGVDDPGNLGVRSMLRRSHQENAFDPLCVEQRKELLLALTIVSRVHGNQGVAPSARR